MPQFDPNLNKWTVLDSETGQIQGAFSRDTTANLYAEKLNRTPPQPQPQHALEAASGVQPAPQTPLPDETVVAAGNGAVPASQPVSARPYNPMLLNKIEPMGQDEAVAAAYRVMETTGRLNLEPNLPRDLVAAGQGDQARVLMSDLNKPGNPALDWVAAINRYRDEALAGQRDPVETVDAIGKMIGDLHAQGYRLVDTNTKQALTGERFAREEVARQAQPALPLEQPATPQETAPNPAGAAPETPPVQQPGQWGRPFQRQPLDLTNATEEQVRQRLASLQQSRNQLAYQRERGTQSGNYAQRLQDIRDEQLALNAKLDELNPNRFDPTAGEPPMAPEQVAQARDLLAQHNGDSDEAWRALEFQARRTGRAPNKPFRDQQALLARYQRALQRGEIAPDEAQSAPAPVPAPVPAPEMPQFTPTGSTRSRSYQEQAANYQPYLEEVQRTYGTPDFEVTARDLESRIQDAVDQMQQAAQQRALGAVSPAMQRRYEDALSYLHGNDARDVYERLQAGDMKSYFPVEGNSEWAWTRNPGQWQGFVRYAGERLGLQDVGELKFTAAEKAAMRYQYDLLQHVQQLREAQAPATAGAAALPNPNVGLMDLAAGGDGAGAGIIAPNTTVRLLERLGNWLDQEHQPTQAAPLSRVAQLGDQAATALAPILPYQQESLAQAELAHDAAARVRDALVGVPNSGITVNASAAQVQQAMRQPAMKQALRAAGVSDRDLGSAQQAISEWQRATGMDLLTNNLDDLAWARIARSERSRVLREAGGSPETGAAPGPARQAINYLLQLYKGTLLATPHNVLQNTMDTFVKNGLMGYDLPYLRDAAGQGDRIGQEMRSWGMTKLPPEIAQGYNALLGDHPEQISAKLKQLPLVGAGLQVAEKNAAIFRRANEVVEEAARTAVYFPAKLRAAQAALPDFLSDVRAEALRQGLDADVIAGQLRATGGKFDAGALYDVLHGAGMSDGASNQFLRRWATVLHDADRAGVAEANRIHFDYGDKTNADAMLSRLVPFHVWATRNIPLYLDYLAGHPGLVGALEAYDAETRQRNEQRGLPGRLGGMRDLGMHGLAQALFGRGTRFFADPTQLLSLRGQVRDLPPNDENTGLGQLYDAGARFGLTPWAPLSLGLQMTGALGQRPVPTLLPQSRLVQGFTGLNPEAPAQGALETVRQLLTGRQTRTVSGSVATDVAVNKLIAQQSLEDTGLPVERNPHYLAAYDDPSNPIWQKAFATYRREQQGMAAARYVSPLPFGTLPDTEARIDQARADVRAYQGAPAMGGRPAVPADPNAAPVSPAERDLAGGLLGIGDSPEKLQLRQQIAELATLGTPQQQNLWRQYGFAAGKLRGPEQIRFLQHLPGDYGIQLKQLLDLRSQYMQQPEHQLLRGYFQFRSAQGDQEAADASVDDSMLNQFLRSQGKPVEADQSVPTGTGMPLAPGYDPAVLVPAINAQVGRIQGAGQYRAAAAGDPRNKLGGIYLAWRGTTGGTPEQFVMALQRDPKLRQAAGLDQPLPAAAGAGAGAR